MAVSLLHLPQHFRGLKKGVIWLSLNLDFHFSARKTENHNKLDIMFHHLHHLQKQSILRL